MLRIKNILVGDIRFQFKYGFYFLYTIFLVMYVGILSMLSGTVKTNVGNILIYSDPAAMGMFFMGAIVLLEKSQRVLDSIAISPVTPAEYIVGKIISIGLVSLIVGGILAVYVGSGNLPLTLLGIMMASCMFSCLGLIVGSVIRSLNQYVIGTVPFEVLGFLPPIAMCLGFMKDKPFMLLHPGCAMMQMIEGNKVNLAFALISSILWNMILFIITRKFITTMFRSVGGVKL
jgi:fluoroquinolone transport system permease protein